MGRITIPTIDQIKGATVMIKLRNLISHFIDFTKKVNDTLDEFEATLKSGSVKSVASTQSNDTVTVTLTMNDDTAKVFSFQATSGVTIDTVQNILAKKFFKQGIEVEGTTHTQAITATGDITAQENVTVAKSLEVDKDAYFQSNVEIAEELKVSGQAEIDGMSIEQSTDNSTVLSNANGVKVNGHNLNNVVTTDEINQKCVRKIFESDTYRQCVFKNTTQPQSKTGGQYIHDILFTGSDNNEFGELLVTGDELKLRACGVDNQHKGYISASRRGLYSQTITPASNAPSTAIITKGYAESTDGVTNNLVHNIGDENIAGVKTFENAETVKKLGHYNNRPDNILSWGSNGEFTGYKGLYPPILNANNNTHIVRHRLDFNVSSSGIARSVGNGFQFYFENKQGVRKTAILKFSVNHSNGNCYLEVIPTNSSDPIRLASWKDEELIDGSE